MNLNERKRLVRWVFKMYQAYALLCDKGDRDNSIFKDEARDARDEIARAIYAGDFDSDVPSCFDDFSKLLGKQNNDYLQ